MKTLIKNITKLFAVAALIFGGTVFAEASFVSDPSTQGNGITSIGLGFYDANEENSISLDIPNKGDSEDFYVFIDYQNASNSTLNDVRGRITHRTSGTDSSTDFVGKLSASNGQSKSDEATLEGLPRGWEIDFISAKAINTHGSYCGSKYEYSKDINSVTSSDGALIINKLDTEGTSSTNGYNGACSQGHVVAQFIVTNISSKIPVDDGPGEYEWETGLWGSCVNFTQERDLSCVDSNGTQVNSSNCAGLSRPSTFRTCSSSGDSVVVETLEAENIRIDRAELHGDQITGGRGEHYWFVYSRTDSTPECTLFPNDKNVSASNVGGGSNPNFSREEINLVEGERYYYRACVTVDGVVYGGGVESFVLDGNGGSNGDDRPDATTDSASSVRDDSAQLNGEIDMNDFDDGDVFFVWGQDENDIEDVDKEDSYSDVRTSGDAIDKERVENGFNGTDDFDLDVNDLDKDERYYFRICVEYYDNGSELECGSVKNFSTDDDNNNGGNDNVDIETSSYDDIGATFATICGDLQDDGGDRSLRTRMEFRRTDGGSWITSNYEQRGEGKYCVRINNLQPSTRYQYRACTDERDCGNTRNFVTVNNTGGPVGDVGVNTLPPTAVSTTSALLNGIYRGSENESTRVWFEWGTSAGLGIQKQVFTRSSLAGDFTDSFTGLRACTRYFYRAVAQNSNGIVYGNTYSFKTSCVINTGGPDVIDDDDDVIIVKDVEEERIDLNLLGLGLSLIRLEIDNDQEALFRDQVVEYEVSWENISTIDLDEIDLKISIPSEVNVTNISRGRFDADENNVYYTIDELEEGEDGIMTIAGIVSRGSLGDLVTAEAAAAYDNPINDAQENATDYDTDEFVLNTNFGTASVFGLSNITFLGWLTILLGLLIIFLIARWLYLEREEMKAQAYASAYRRPVLEDPRYGYQQPTPIAPSYRAEQPLPGAAPQAMVNETPLDDGYQPYRPNRS